MDMRGRYGGYVDLHPVKMTSPTCEDLGIPTDLGEEGAGGLYPLLSRRIIHSPGGLHLDGLRYGMEGRKRGADPYSPLCMIPLPGALALHAAVEPSFIRKRNERERERVRCVNEGYERLKEHLPLANKDKRISKVETLRGAIEYIRQLQQLLADVGTTSTDASGENRAPTIKARAGRDQDRHDTSRANDLGVVVIPGGGGGGDGTDLKKRRQSGSSEKAGMSDSSRLAPTEDELSQKKRRIVTK